MRWREVANLLGQFAERVWSQPVAVQKTPEVVRPGLAFREVRVGPPLAVHGAAQRDGAVLGYALLRTKLPLEPGIVGAWANLLPTSGFEQCGFALKTSAGHGKLHCLGTAAEVAALAAARRRPGQGGFAPTVVHAPRCTLAEALLGCHKVSGHSIRIVVRQKILRYCIDLGICARRKRAAFIINGHHHLTHTHTHTHTASDSRRRGRLSLPVSPGAGECQAWQGWHRGEVVAGVTAGTGVSLATWQSSNRLLLTRRTDPEEESTWRGPRPATQRAAASLLCVISRAGTGVTVQLMAAVTCAQSNGHCQ